ncbi:LytTR family transcriptional regulator DNA-binding domain-containing protein [Sphingobacterium sp. UDSM-2020]|uniref:LytTR family transcriptional regulator DNA-binding domain-containing protein n=1 Tax=Sphingobacterium sp. UDSM-2020 TaxID=2795738 RepID=UPI00193909CF|nr:LytTR family transcriptional regulator DNA-binding domain-containing protein [Sphingobacterium sp. UDSM-2020]QQD14256.1 LytTR family transcriptional regulator DNA-binding domain-containing protein [Sphingobacterium sp. UDSM-2020]
MKLSVTLIKWIVLGVLSVAGGLTMYLINENEGIFEIWNDSNLFLNLGSSVFSVALFLVVSYQLAKLAPLILPLKYRTAAYFIRYFCLQILISGGGSLLIAILFAAIIVYSNSGLWLGDTSYFKVDFFFVCLAVIFLQVILFVVYFLFSFKQVNHIGDEQESDAEADYIRLLEEIKVYQLSLGGKMSETSRLKELQGIDLADVHYIYSERKIRYIQSERYGKTMFDGVTLEQLITMLPKEDFFPAGRHLIVSRKAIASFKRLADYRIELTLDPPFHLKSKLSETATRLFKTWYYDGGVDDVDH